MTEQTELERTRAAVLRRMTLPVAGRAYRALLHMDDEDALAAFERAVRRDEAKWRRCDFVKQDRISCEDWAAHEGQGDKFEAFACDSCLRKRELEAAP